MIEIETKLSGDLESGLAGFAEKIQGEALVSAAAAMALVVYDEVKLNTSGARAKKRPKDFVGPMQPSPPGLVTGTLHSAVYRTLSESRSDADTKAYHVGINKGKAPHWHWLEYGNSRMAARPYLRPAYDTKVDEAVKAGLARLKEKVSGR